MLTVITYLWQLLWFKTSPEQCPYDRQAAVGIAVISVIWVSARLQDIVPLPQAIMAASVPLIAMLGVLFLFLNAVKKTGRLIQLYTMIQGTSLILSVLGNAVGLLFQQQAPILDLILGFWHFTIMIVVFGSAFETSKMKAVGLSVAFQLMILILVAPLSLSMLSSANV